MSNLVRRLAFGTPLFNIAPYGKISHRLVKLRCNCEAKWGLRVLIIRQNESVPLDFAAKISESGTSPYSKRCN